MDSLQFALNNAKEDTTRVLILIELGTYSNSYEETLQFDEQGLSLAQKIKFYRAEANLSNDIGNYYWNVSNYPKALGYYLQGLKVSEEYNFQTGKARSLGNLGNVYLSLENYRLSLIYSFKAKIVNEAIQSYRGSRLIWPLSARLISG